jgi:pimeloyl-ACP methyl ester carboxylesterase
MFVRSSEHWVSTERGRLFAKTWMPPDQPLGTKAAIVLFHDSLGCVDVWRDFPERLALATQHFVVAYDRLGFGRSDPYPGFLSADFMRDEAATSVPRLREQLGFDAMIPFGHSVGGAMAVATAMHLPDCCVALVTESAQAFVEDRTLAGIRAAQAAFRDPDEFERLERYHGGKARWVLDAWTETWLEPTFKFWSLDDDLRQVRCPTLAIHGDQDEYGSLRHLERIARLTSGPTKAVIVSACGHVPHREQPERVLREVAQFLAPGSATSEPGL